MSQKARQSETKRAHWKHQKPQSREQTIQRVSDGNFFAVTHEANEFAPELIRAEWTFDFILVISSHIIAVGSNTDDTVQNKNSLIAAVKSNIVSFE